MKAVICTGKSSTRQALAAAVTREFTKFVMEASRKNGRLFELGEEYAHFLTPDEVSPPIKKFGEAILENWDWAWTTDVDNDKKVAIEMMGCSIDN